MRNHALASLLLSASFLSCGSSAADVRPAGSAAQAAALTAPASAAPGVAEVAEPAAATPAAEPRAEPAGGSTSAEATAAEVAPGAITKKTTAPPKKLLILGDSMAATDFGRALEKLLKKNRRFAPKRRGKSATGLARPDFFDWTKEARRLLKRHKPEVVVVILGGNDGQDLITVPAGSARRVVWDSKRWRPGYAARVRDFATLLRADGRQLVWLELPLMEKRSLERKLQIIRAIQRGELAGLPGVTYLPTRQHLTKEDGRLRRWLRVGKRRKAWRQDDGIHFTLDGAKRFAEHVYQDLTEALTPPVEN